MSDELHGGSTASTKSCLIGAYGSIVFDCDGVLLDSNQFKIDAFREVLAANGYSDTENDAFCHYQATNFGTSRYRLFELLLAGQFGPPRDIPIEKLLSDFSEACRAGYLRQPETPGMRQALDRAGQNHPLYVVSGSDEAELRDVLETRGLASYFAGIFGSPRNKVENLVRVRDDYVRNGGTATARFLFIGDAFADMQAAEKSDADFLFMARYSTVRERLEMAANEAGHGIIEDLRELI